ncbi:galactosyltransferase-like protein [Anaerobacterium chartisolvens]|uniref:Galactosyltransferase-like protein n=1 Tax=Anaerobacterium chartisolvens TaxID=1297424 RepID=A0A369BEW6_9FIRM|nr:glycosyltransferase [Anaerobacterium chartisolvens]RCX20080.1 galactosyltransferase-like protein [Anaerobacterium chartisolvens]
MRKYSFIIPAYQSKILLKNTLEALNHQLGFTGEGYEVIVVDDGSTDSTYDLIKNIGTSYSLKYIYLERCAVSSRSRARNHGLKKACGDIIVFIDADIIVRNNFLLELDRCYSMDSNLLIAGTRLLLPERVDYGMLLDGSVYEKYRFSKENEELMEFRHKIFDHLSYNAAAMKNPFLYTLSCNMSVPKTWLEKVGGFDEDLKRWGIEDIELAYRLFKKGIRIVFNSRNEVLHQFHGKQEDFVTEDKISGLDENIKVFLKKHPGALGLKEHEIYQLFRSIATYYKDLEKRYDAGETIMLEFRDKQRLGQFKEELIMLAEDKSGEIIVNDFVEDTDLDIWIQLQSYSRCIVKYYPASKSCI